jgi:hypothetical protein
MSTYNVTLPTPDTDNVFKIDDTEYYFDAVLYNANEEFVRLRVQNITELILEDNFLSPFHKGTLTFKNNLDAIERVSNVPYSQSPDQFSNFSYVSKDIILPFSFRGDCRDFLLIDIVPKLTDDPNYQYGDDINTLWRLKFLFSIYDTEDIIGSDPNEKYKKLFFHDYNHQILNEKNIDFATANFIKTKDVINLDNTARGIKTGLAIKNIINTTFPKREGFDIKFGDWDEGATSIFYSSPGDAKAIDDLDYVLQHHVSDAGNNFDFSILRKERYINAYTLRSLKTYFDNAYIKRVTSNVDGGGPLHLEKFHIGTADREDSRTITQSSRSPTGPKNSAHLPAYSTISNYKFSPPAGIDVQNLLTTIMVHTYNPESKEFVADFRENQFTRSLEVFNKNYVQNQKGSFGTSAFSSLTKNEFRLANNNYENTYTPYYESAEQRLAFGRNKFLKDALFLNNTLNFESPGLTLRQAGRFISVDRESGQPDSKFDDKLLGTYFIVNIKHIFTNSSYKNSVTCVKPYLFADPKNNSVVL